MKNLETYSATGKQRRPVEIDMSRYEGVARQFDEFYSKTLFHEPAWLDYLQRTNKGKPRFLQIGDPSDNHDAYHVFLEKRLGPLKVMGSPLPGWTTNFMGPLLRYEADLVSVIEAIKTYIARNGFVYAEIKNPYLDAGVMTSCGFSPVRHETALLTLDEDEEKAWSRLKSTARNRIRKAEKTLTVEATRDVALIDEYYSLVVERYREQGMAFPFSVERLHRLAECLIPHDKLVMIKVTHGERVAAAGLFPHDERAIYYFGGASQRDMVAHCPNELMHWAVIRYAVERGIRTYDLCGTSQFKRKFGAVDMETASWCYSPVPGLLAARSLLVRGHWARLRWQHKLKSWLSP
jgi:hypothetical protein